MNKKQDCDFDVSYKGEVWHIFECWLDRDREPQYYIGETKRKGVRFERTIAASEIKHPYLKQQSEKGDND